MSNFWEEDQDLGFDDEEAEAMEKEIAERNARDANNTKPPVDQRKQEREPSLADRTAKAEMDSILSTQRLVIGRMIHDPSYVAAAIAMGLTQNDFTGPGVGPMFSTIKDLFAKNKNYQQADVLLALNSDGVTQHMVDTFLLSIPMEDRGIHAARNILIDLWSRASETPPSTQALRDIQVYAESRSLQLKLARGLAELKIVPACEREAVLDKIKADVSVAQRHEEKPALRIRRVMEEAFLAPQEVRCPTGYARLDLLAGSMAPGLVIVGGASGSGKTSFVRSMALQLAQGKEFAVLLFSLDCVRAKVASGFMHSVARVNSSSSGSSLTDAQALALENASNTVRDLPIWIDDRRALTMEQIENTIVAIRGDVEFHQRKLVVVLDHIQLLRVARGDQDAAWQLADMAHKHGVTIVATSTLIERWRGKKTTEGESLNHDAPQLVDVPGPVREAANRVLLIHNYAATHRAEMFFDGNKMAPEEERVVLIVAKNHDGAVGRIEMSFAPHFQVFEDREPVRSASIETSSDADAYANDGSPEF